MRLRTMHPSTIQFCGTTALATVQSAPSRTRESSRNRFRSELSDLTNCALRESRRSSLINHTSTMHRVPSGEYTPICPVCQYLRSRRITAILSPSSTTNLGMRGSILRIENTQKQSMISSNHGKRMPKTNQATKSRFDNPTKMENTKVCLKSFLIGLASLISHHRPIHINLMGLRNGSTSRSRTRLG
jgi:hypothetical protein